MGHNSAEHLHTVIEAAKLAFADREAYYGDPLFDEVPFDRLLSGAYNEGRRELIGEGASGDLLPGDVGIELAIGHIGDVLKDNRAAMGLASGQGDPDRSPSNHAGDTTQLDAIDAEGNMVAATPSGGWITSSPLVKGLGFALGTRGQMFYLNAKRANALAPRKRPRATLTPSLVTRDGRPWMVFGTPGGDNQDQWTLQFFLNYVDFGMTIQEALEAPTVHSQHFPSSFYPRGALPKRVVAESRIPGKVIDELRERGHDVVVAGAFAHGKPMAIRFDAETGGIFGGVSPKGGIGYALGW
jgi:gamma-glutamyltranspeptidase/glutathione hydrolase